MLLLDDLLQVVEVQSCMYLQVGPVQLCYWYSSNSGYNTFDNLRSEAIAFGLGRGGGRGRGRGGGQGLKRMLCHYGSKVWKASGI